MVQVPPEPPGPPGVERAEWAVRVKALPPVEKLPNEEVPRSHWSSMELTVTRVLARAEGAEGMEGMEAA